MNNRTYSKSMIDNIIINYTKLNLVIGDEIPEIDITMSSVPIVAKPRKLKCTWTPSLMQDLAAMHGISVGEEMEPQLVIGEGG